MEGHGIVAVCSLGGDANSVCDFVAMVTSSVHCRWGAVYVQLQQAKTRIITTDTTDMG